MNDQKQFQKVSKQGKATFLALLLFAVFIVIWVAIVKLDPSGSPQSNNNISSSSNLNASSNVNKSEPTTAWTSYYFEKGGYTVHNPGEWYLETRKNNPRIDLTLSTPHSADSVLGLIDKKGIVIHFFTRDEIEDIETYLRSEVVDTGKRFPGLPNEYEMISIDGEDVWKWKFDALEVEEMEGSYRVSYYKGLNGQFLEFAAYALSEQQFEFYKETH